MATCHEDDGHIAHVPQRRTDGHLGTPHPSIMMAYLAASWHNLYTKCIHVYLQQMHKLHESHPRVSRHFDQGFHVVRRSDRFWEGLSPDLVIEQVLMRSMKTSGGLTRGRGMTETQRLVWLMAHPVCAEVNNAMQQRTGVQHNTSEQHKDLTTARQVKDMTDTCELLQFLESRNSFSDNCSSQSIATGINDGISGNVDTANEVGEKILTSMAQQNATQIQVTRPNCHAQYIGCQSQQLINPQLLFQRLIAAGTRNDQLEEIFEFELCSYSPAIQEPNTVAAGYNLQ